MFQFTSRDLLAGVTAFSVGISLHHWIALPGMVAAGLFVFAIAATLLGSQSVAPRQVLFVAYFFLLLEFAWCAPANYSVVQWSYPPPNYWNTTAPIHEALGLSALVLVPLLFGAYAIVATLDSHPQERHSRLLKWAAILGTTNVILMYLSLYAVCWFGMSHVR